MQRLMSPARALRLTRNEKVIGSIPISGSRILAFLLCIREFGLIVGRTPVSIRWRVLRQSGVPMRRRTLIAGMAMAWGSAFVAVPVAAAGPPTQQAYVKASNSGSGVFGSSVAIDGDTMVIGAPGEDSSATGVDGDQTDTSAGQSGAAYVFTRSGSAWSQQAYLKASNTEAGDQFGYSVAISGDTIVVGANIEDSSATGVNGNQADNSAGQSGAAYVFTRSGSAWSQQAYLKASNTGAIDGFGSAVEISGDALVIGAPGEDSSAAGIDGDQSDNSAADSGAAYVFTRSGSTWSQQAYVKASNTGAGDFFGYFATISGDGDTIAIGAPTENSSAVGIDGDQSDNSAGDSGAAYVFTRLGSTWSQQAYVKASNTGAGDWFGSSVSFFDDTLVVGANQEDSSATGVDGDQTDNSAADSGAAYVFTRSGSAWSQQAYVKASNTGAGDYFGTDIAISADMVAVGAHLEDSSAVGIDGDQSDNSAANSGAAYVFARSGSAWTQQSYVKASNTDAGDLFGADVAISGDTTVVGAGLERSDADGIDGDQTDNSAATSGAAYVFVSPPTTFTTGPTASISGTARQGQTLTAGEGSPVPAPDSFSYVWLADGVTIPGATAKTFKLTSAQVGKKISVTVTAHKAGLDDASDTSPETVPVVGIFIPGPTATISGYAQVGSTLTARPGSISPAPTSLAYRWYADGVKLSNTAKTLKLTSTHRGKRITVRIYAIKPGYLTAADTSPATARVSSLQAKTISLELNDYTVRRGQRVYANLDELAAREPWSIVLDGKKLASGTADSQGYSKTSFVIPAIATLGIRTIHAYGKFPDRTDPDRITVR
jgi:hypothetical protein